MNQLPLLALFLVLLWGPSQAASCGQAKPDANDALTAAPLTHKLILENERVRVIEETIPAKSKEKPHSHVWPSVVIEDQDGADPKAGSVFHTAWSKAGTKFSINNTSSVARHIIRIELKQTDCEPIPHPELPATDGVTIHDPGIKVALENPHVRVLEVTVPPGEKEPMHTHTWQAIVYYLRLPPSRRIAADGSSQPRAELKQLQVTFDPNSQPPHSVENLGAVAYQAHRIELKPVTDHSVKN